MGGSRGPPVSIECICKNINCIWNGKKQITHEGLGKFDIVEIYCDIICRKCDVHIKTSDIIRVGFNDCKYKFYYVTSGGNMERFEMNYYIEVPNKPCFIDDNINGIHYNKLEFNVIKN